MTSLNFSLEAIELLRTLGFEYEEGRTDKEYIEDLLSIADLEDCRIASKAADLEKAGLYPSGMSNEDNRRVRLLDEIFNKIADA